LAIHLQAAEPYSCQLPTEGGRRQEGNYAIVKGVEEVVQGSCRLPCFTGGQFMADAAARIAPEGNLDRIVQSKVNPSMRARESVFDSLSGPTR